MTEELTAKKARQDFLRAYEWKKKWLDSAKEDFEFALGKQWKDEDKKKLEDQGRPALTINTIRPNIFLLTGIESQNRTDFKAFPEGQEDSVVADIATKLLKNVSKNSGLGFKTSQQFEEGITCGDAFIEPWMDYTYDLLNGELKFKKLDYNQIFPAPGFREYDMSDARYVCKVSYDLTKDELLSLFPDKETEIDEISQGKIVTDQSNSQRIGGVERQRFGYPADEKGANVDDRSSEQTYDLLEYSYKKFVPTYFVLDEVLGTVKQTSDKQEADNYAAVANAEYRLKVTQQAQQVGQQVPDEIPDSAHVVKRMIPEIWVMSIVGMSEEELDNKKAWCFPEWKSYQYIPFMCYWMQTPLQQGDRDLTVQGMVRALKDPQFEKNKRRSQELAHLNTSINSGLEYEENQLVNEDEVKQFGASPGIHIKRKAGTPAVIRHNPTPLSAGHAQMAAEHAQDMKDISGVNTDLLAMQEGGQSSGRAISLRQRQGLVMVQKIFDNLSQTKWILGKFVLSQLGNIFDMDRAVRVLGEAFIQENFSVPVTQPAQGPAGPVQVPVMDPMTGQPQMQIDQKAVVSAIQQVLTDSSLGKYDVAVGEGANNETVKYANYMQIVEMAQNGIPIPPEVIVEESSLSEASKKKIVAGIEQAQAAAATPQPGKKAA